MSRARLVALAMAGLALAIVGAVLFGWLSYPDDRSVEGAYLRIVSAVHRDRPDEFFAYLETEAQHASFTIRNYRRKARDRVLAAYPRGERARVAERYAAEAAADDGAGVFALYAQRRGWLPQLRRDLSGVAKIEEAGELATLQTARGTRYSFRRRDNGIWGLTLFTAELVAEAERAARDYEIIDVAARDHERVRRRQEPAPPRAATSAKPEPR